MATSVVFCHGGRVWEWDTRQLPAESYRGMYKKAFPLFHNFEAAISMASTARIVGCFPFAPNNTFPQHRCRRHSIRILSSAGESSAASLTSESAELNTVAVNGAAPAPAPAPDLLNRNRFAIPNETTAEEAKGFREEKLEPLWDDGYGSETVKQYFEYAEDLIRPDGGPARWFTPISCGPPLKDSPVLLFLPGMDGLGVGLILHHKALGKVFDVRCMHIPVQDRTPFQDLVKWVEETVKAEHSSSPNKPIYLLGDSFGGCLALAVAARNPHIDLVLILTNPATSFGASQLQPILPLLEALPDELHIAVPYLLSFVMGDPVKMAAVDIDKMLPPARFFEQLSSKLTGLLPCLSGLSDIIPKETLLWRLKLLRDSAAYTNSRLHTVKAEVLVLASGKDNMLPSRDEAWRLMRTLRNCDVRYFKDNGHTILLEDGVNLLTIIKGTTMYRRTSRSHDYVLDFIPPSMSEFQQIQQNGWFRNFVGPVFLSTREDGSIVRGLEGVPSEGPVLFVGYHMLMGFDLGPLIEQFLREKKIMVRGMAHLFLFSDVTGSQDKEFSYPDTIRLYGAVPVTASNLFKMLKAKSHVLLYPGGAREALHKKGEEYKLFWPDDPEFVRMAARFGATIVPFGSVGEDDIAELVLDIEDQLKIPFWGDKLRNDKEKYKSFNIRAGKRGEVSNQFLHLPGLVPKVSGRYYYLFGKPISTKGRDEMLKDRDKARELYLHVKSQVEANMAYLLEKRERDPYRSVVDRTVYRAFHSPMDHVPTFEP